MRVDHSTGVVLPVVAASLMGAGSVLAFGLIASPGNAEVRSAESAAPVRAASTAPPPITLTGPVGTAGTGRAVLAAEPVRHPRAQRPTGRDPRTASARPADRPDPPDRPGSAVRAGRECAARQDRTAAGHPGA
ncbi:MAG: hypothetical protein IPJ14_05170 [Kineosporiaceae bacterium]|nr:hypothetical protein [Kineosporiaceae bacterium]